MRHRLLLAVSIVLLAGAILWWLIPRGPGPAATPPISSDATIAAASQAAAPGSEPVSGETTPAAAVNSSPDEGAPALPKHSALAAAAELPSGPQGDPGLPPQTVLENMRAVFRQYSARFGGNPVGTNPEITAALNGQNPRQVVFLNPEDGLRINGRGELVDNWGTPFFFHQLSRTEMEIHSAGPDRKMWTSDDLVIK